MQLSASESKASDCNRCGAHPDSDEWRTWGWLTTRRQGVQCQSQQNLSPPSTGPSPHIPGKLAPAAGRRWLPQRGRSSRLPPVVPARADCPVSADGSSRPRSQDTLAAITTMPSWCGSVLTLSPSTSSASADCRWPRKLLAPPANCLSGKHALTPVASYAATDLPTCGRWRDVPQCHRPIGCLAPADRVAGVPP